MRRRLAVALEGLPHLGDLLRRGEAVLLGNVQRQRLLDLPGLAQQVAEADAVVADVAVGVCACRHEEGERSEEHTSELQYLMRISYAVFCLKKKTTTNMY